jgi:hypothetical protein
MITFKLQEIPKISTQIAILLCDIDKKLVCLASKRKDEIRFSFSNTTNYYDYMELIMLRKIIINKACNDDCLSCVDSKDLIGIIQNLLYKFCC